MGGEKPDIYRQLSLLGGSPPHGRGKACRHAQLDNQGRITPAWAGKSRRTVFAVFHPEDHPRVGGEKGFWPGFLLSLQGSPPRGRGKDVYCTLRMISPGITPAWAGKRIVCPGFLIAERDHPRVGGEKRSDRLDYYFPQGSPPRGRGKAIRLVALWLAGRITPAWAGKSRFCRLDSCPERDHPRVGGEKCTGHSKGSGCPGSPPRGRGKVLGRALQHRGRGITPAWAGKSARYPAQGSACWDHPRVGGEKWGNKNQHFGAKGSPPRGRGKVLAPAPTWQSPRITPAWAGKRVRRPSWSYGGGDHPRVGGEKIAALFPFPRL